MFLLDTNVVSELRKPKPHGGVVAWLRGLEEHDLYISALTLGELQRGVEKTREGDQERATEIERWIDQVQNSYRVLVVDGAIFREWARLISGRQDHLLEDGLIAATARVHRLTIATRNVKDFGSFGVKVVNPFSAR